MVVSSKIIGILGGGQLARMLSLRAREMGLSTYVLSEKKSDPAATVCSKWFEGNLSKPEDIKSFSEKVDVITFESEFLPGSLLKKTLPQKNKCFPQVHILSKLQDRWPQKELLWDYKIPTSPFMKINSKDDLDLAFVAYKNKMVIKQRFGGYDGFGTHFITSSRALENFKNRFAGFENHFIVEALINFRSEKSLIFARNLKGQIRHYPLFTTVQKNKQCDQVFGPASHPKEKSLVDKIEKLLKEMNYVGVIAFELFDIGHDLIVNEVAPRVHNTGHITMDAFLICQFELHLRCVLNIDLPKDNPHSKSFLMQNLSGKTHRLAKIEKGLNGRLHWYEKLENRPGRKMGHVNYVNSSVTQLKKYAEQDKKKIHL